MGIHWELVPVMRLVEPRLAVDRGSHVVDPVVELAVPPRPDQQRAEVRPRGLMRHPLGLQHPCQRLRLGRQRLSYIAPPAALGLAFGGRPLGVSAVHHTVHVRVQQQAVLAPAAAGALKQNAQTAALPCG